MKTVFLDTGYVLALELTNDQNHRAALKHWRSLRKRLMLLSSMSILEPAMFRIWRWPVFQGVDGDLSSLAVLLLLLVVLSIYDVLSRRRMHAVTVLGGTFLMGSRIVSLFVIATSEVGRSFVRGLS